MGRTKGGAHHQHHKNKIKKRCLRCGVGYKGVTALSIKPVNPDKPEPGLCPKCQKSDENFISEDDLNLQNELGVE